MIRISSTRKAPAEPERAVATGATAPRPPTLSAPPPAAATPPPTPPPASLPPLEPMTVAEFIARMPRPSPCPPQLEAPPYSPSAAGGPYVGLAVENMRRHMSDEGWRLFEGLELADYTLCGHNLPLGSTLHSASLTDVPTILKQYDPGIVVVQDKREWEGFTANQAQNLAAMRFSGVEALRRRPDIFKLTVLKDSHQRPAYHREAADEIGCHAWIVYYQPRIVAHLASYVRPEHLVRTHHCVDPASVPAYSPNNRGGALLSGAVSSAYPLRTRLVRDLGLMPDVTRAPHPGYHCNGCVTPQYLRLMSQFKVSICTSSVYGYALRKIVESTAAGCVVVTDLPVDEVLPEIDGNLVRIHPDLPTCQIGALVRRLIERYSPDRQRAFSDLARQWYSVEAVGRRLAEDIESLRRRYQK